MADDASAGTLLLVASESWPYPTGNGSAVLLHGLIRSFQELGYRVFFTAVHQDLDSAKAKKSYPHLEALGVPFIDPGHWLTPPSSKLVKARRVFVQRNDEILPASEDWVRELHRTSGVDEFDVAIGYSWHSLGATASVRAKCHIASLVDPIERQETLRRELLHQLPLHRRLLTLNGIRHLRRLNRLAMAKLRDFDLILEHAYHHAEELRDAGYRKVVYLPHPMVPPEEDKLVRGGSPDSRVVLIPGSLKGVASRRGFEFFLDEVLPAFRRMRNDDEQDIVFRIVGHGQMLPRLADKLRAEPEVRLVGFAEDIDEEYRAAAMILVCIPVDQGFRTRIAECFGRSTCVVLHQANTAGMPEIVDHDNALVSATGEGLAERILAGFREPELRRQIAERASATFLESYSLDSAVKTIGSALAS